MAPQLYGTSDLEAPGSVVVGTPEGWLGDAL
jgi:hypothetical protein